MVAYEKNLGIVSRRRTRVLPRAPIMSKNVVPPKGLPMDFYNLKWYKSLSHYEKRIFPDRKNIAFLPNAGDCMQAQRHPDEKLTDKQFNEKYRGPIEKVFEISDEGEDTDEDEDNDGDNESIDLEATSEGEDNEEEPEFYGPGEYSYEDDDFSPEEGEESEEESEEEGSEGGAVENTQNEGMEGIEI
ncbi:hypothetical protein O181_043870 [Austropuccinia psidii MF-1]|uniref:DNA-directed RNA polymerase III subunit n=1 Tax=Austropuccinia psidii MF-1 TaxID=1389203 RepID=A0A9Q3DNF5_9BASI|nr:hypothetical protein [Austropuccinia psidii MF-1]